MKFVVSSSALLKLLTGLGGIIPTHPVVQILENFLFQLAPGQLTVTASDFETSIVATLPIEGNETGEIAVPARILLDTLKNLPDQPVTFTVEPASFAVVIESGNGRYKLAGENGAGFPRVPQAPHTQPLELPSSSLFRAINKTIFAASTDELRPAMTGVLVELKADRTTFVATDGHRLLRYGRLDVQRPAGGEERKFILPRKACVQLQKGLPNDKDSVPVTVELGQGHAFFAFNNTRLVCRLIDERYPDYENVIPVANPNVLVMNRQELLASVRRISVYANKTTHQVRLRLDGQQVVISAEDLDFANEASETLPCQYNGEALEIGYNARFLLEMLSNLDCEEISLALSTPNRAGLLSPKLNEEAENVLMLVMPVMLNTYA